jgi:hypothetical protein
MKLTELLAPYKGEIKTVRNSSTAVWYETEIVGEAYIFNASKSRYGWAFSFAQANQDENAADDDALKHGTTGTGHEFQVFSFVLTCLEKLIAAQAPTTISFTADKSNPARVSLYRKLVKRFAAGWELSEDDGSIEVQFTLTKKVRPVRDLGGEA